MSLHSDFKDLLSAFADERVEYLLVGGYAVGYHGRPRFTKDIDLWVGEEPSNLERVYRALATFGAPEAVLAQLGDLGPEEILYLGAPPLRVDIFKRIPGVEFTAAYADRVEATWDGTPVSIISLTDLIAAKRASGREQDLIDIRELTDGERE
jgi:predicted nucleotidyltransferase